MKEQPPFSEEGNEKKKIPKKPKVPKNVLETRSDIAEIQIDDLIQTSKEENVADKIIKLEEIFDVYYSLEEPTRVKIDNLIETINKKKVDLDLEINNKTNPDIKRITEERHELYKKSRILLKIKEHFLSRLWKNK